MSRHIPNALTRTLRETLREPYAWPGGYTKAIYLADGERICPKCARENYHRISQSTREQARDGWALLCIEAYWEGPPEHCVECNIEMPSEYGDPEAKGEDKQP